MQYNTLKFSSGPACGRCRWFVFDLQWLVSAPWALQMICFSSAMLRKPYNYNVFGNCCCVEMLQSLHFYIRSGSAAMQIKCKFTLILNEVIPMDIYIQLCYMTNICCNAKSIWVSGKGGGSGLGVENTCRLKKNPRINVNDSGLRQALIENLFELVGRGEEPCRLKNPPRINVNDFGQGQALMQPNAKSLWVSGKGGGFRDIMLQI